MAEEERAPAAERPAGAGRRDPLRVAMVAYTRYRTDARVRRQAEALAARGDQVVCYCLREEGRGRHEEGGVTVVELPLARYRGGRPAAYLAAYLTFLVMAAAALTASHLRRRFHVVQVHTLPDFMVLAALPARLLGARVILDLHDTAPETYAGKFGLSLNHPLIRALASVERLTARLAHKLLAVHDAQKEALVARGHQAARVAVVMNTPDERLFPARGPAAGRRRRDDFHVIYHGTIARRHGLDLLVQAVAGLADKIPPLRLTVCGEGDSLAEVAREAERLGLSGRVVFTGMLPLEEMAARLARSDLEVIPLRRDAATDLMLPVKAMEAIACGVPLAVAGCRALRRHFGEAEVTFFEPGDAAAVARAIEGVWSDPRAARARAARALWRQRRLGWRRQRARYLEIVDSLRGGESWDRRTASIRTSRSDRAPSSRTTRSSAVLRTAPRRRRSSRSSAPAP